MTLQKNKQLLQESGLALVVSLADFLVSLLAFLFSFVVEVLVPKAVEAYQLIQKIRKEEVSLQDIAAEKVEELRQVVGEERAEKADQFISDMKALASKVFKSTPAETDEDAEEETLSADTEDDAVDMSSAESQSDTDVITEPLVEDLPITAEDISATKFRLGQPKGRNHLQEPVAELQ